jgi:hypothetical protein
MYQPAASFFSVLEGDALEKILFNYIFTFFFGSLVVPSPGALMWMTEVLMTSTGHGAPKLRSLYTKCNIFLRELSTYMEILHGSHGDCKVFFSHQPKLTHVLFLIGFGIMNG